MLIKTLLNQIEKHKGFVYDRVTFEEGGRPRLIVGELGLEQLPQLGAGAGLVVAGEAVEDLDALISLTIIPG